MPPVAGSLLVTTPISWAIVAISVLVTMLLLIYAICCATNIPYRHWGRFQQQSMELDPVPHAKVAPSGICAAHRGGMGSCLESNAAFGAGRVSRKREHNSSSDESDDSVPHPASRPLLIVKHVSTADDAADDAPTDIQVAIDVSDCPEGEGGQSPGEASRLGAECANVSA